MSQQMLTCQIVFTKKYKKYKMMNCYLPEGGYSRELFEVRGQV